MFKNWIENLFLEENQFIITEMAKIYNLSNEEYSNLVNLMMYYYIIQNNPNTLDAVSTVCEQIQKHREEIQKNQNCYLFRECIEIFLQEEKEKTGNLHKVEEFLKGNFVFHSFNSAFLETINRQGLITKEKPWSLEEVEEIRQIFQSKNKKNIFGLYQGRGDTPIFFANNLVSSAYYGLSSPTFFRKFIENSPQYFNVFLNRDYLKAKESIDNLCKDLEPQEKEKVLHFFQKYWSLFTSNSFPCVAISTKEKLGIKVVPFERRDNETDFQYILRQMSETKSMMIHQDIPRESLDIFEYQSFSFAQNPNEKVNH